MKHSRIIAMIMALVMVFALTACGGETTPDATVNENPTELPTEAPTTVPADICADMGHAWVDATCAAPKTCEICGETEGDALEHTWVDANYQAPKTCSVCNATEGEAIEAYFETMGWEINVTEIGKEYDYTTCFYDKKDESITGKLFVDKYEVFASAEGYPAKEGYEYRCATVKVLFNDNNAKNRPIGTYAGFFNYYDKAGFVPNETEDGQTALTYTLNWNGIDYAECMMYITNGEWSEWTNDGIYFTMAIEALVPIGYDGIVFAFGDGSNYIDQNTTYEQMFTTDALFFRMD